jgi:flagellar assembly protein FliH
MGSFNEGVHSLLRPDATFRPPASADSLDQVQPFQMRTLEAFVSDSRNTSEHPESLDSLLQGRYRDGYEEGQHAAELALQRSRAEESQRLGKSLAQRVQGIGESFEREFTRAEQAIAESLLDLALEVASSVVALQVSIDRQAALAVVRQCLALLPKPAHAGQLRMNPEDLEFLRPALVADLSAYDIELIADGSIQAGGCHLSNDQLTMDSTLAQRWRAAIATIGRGEKPSSGMAAQ